MVSDFEKFAGVPLVLINKPVANLLSIRFVSHQVRAAQLCRDARSRFEPTARQSWRSCSALADRPSPKQCPSEQLPRGTFTF